LTARARASTVAALTLLVATLLALCIAGPVAAAPPSLVEVGDFAEPVYVTAPPGVAGDLFVVERAGRVQLLRGSRQSTYLDIAADVESGGGEQGLLSLAFAPDYATSGLAYVYYTARGSGQLAGQLRVEEVRRSASDPDRADPATRRVVLAQDHPDAANHNGGQLQFGPDRKLYVGMGDGGQGNDPNNNAQSRGTLLGKVLRIDPGRPVPADNPFSGQSGARPEIWAYGLRNPWRFSFDAANADLIIADVGQGDYEEVDRAGSGRGVNFGWRCREGAHPNPNLALSCTAPGAVDPVFEYGHSRGCAIAGGYVVRTPSLASLAGRYVYADHCEGQIRSVSLGAPSDDRTEGLAVSRPTSFGEDGCGNLYVASLMGPVYALRDGERAACPPPAVGVAPPTPTPPPGSEPAADRRGPRVSLRWRSRTRLPGGRLRGLVRCDEACTLLVGARAGTAGRRRALPFRLLALEAGRWTRVALTPRPSTRRAIARARRARRAVRMRVRMWAVDAAGNRSTVLVRRVRLRR
jgi:glucose/arabinose dehydrogenase